MKQLCRTTAAIALLLGCMRCGSDEAGELGDAGASRCYPSMQNCSMPCSNATDCDPMGGYACLVLDSANLGAVGPEDFGSGGGAAGIAVVFQVSARRRVFSLQIGRYVYVPVPSLALRALSGSYHRAPGGQLSRGGRAELRKAPTPAAADSRPTPV
jgi:hypothetical protein